MSEDENIDGLAAEYVLGSLDPAERSEVAARRQKDAALARAIAAWERRLAPLSDRVPGVVPPSHLLERILSRISEQTAPSRRPAEVIALHRQSRRGWGVAVGAALAACLALAVGWFLYVRSHTPTTHAGTMDCSRTYMDFWGNFAHEKYVKMSPEELAGLSRLALRAYDACQAGDEQDARLLFQRLQSGN